MTETLDILNTAVSPFVRAVLPAARFSGRIRGRSRKRLAAEDAHAKAKKILFLNDRVYQLDMQPSIFQKHINSKGRNPRYTVCERLLILWHMKAFQIPKHVPLIRGFDHLTLLCTEFASGYSAWRPDMTLDGLRPMTCTMTHTACGSAILTPHGNSRIILVFVPLLL